MKTLFTLLFLISILQVFGQTIKFEPTPNEDSIRGLNDNCYSIAIGHYTQQEYQDFINNVKPIIDSICQTKSIPAKTILAMAILESGCGFTRTGYYANNLFGIKQPTSDTAGVYVLKGQPVEDPADKAKIIKRFGKDRIVYDEKNRKDNRYRKFATRRACIIYQVNAQLSGYRYQSAINNYAHNLQQNVSSDEAALRFAYDIAFAGYFMEGGPEWGKEYRHKIEGVFKKLK